MRPNVWYEVVDPEYPNSPHKLYQLQLGISNITISLFGPDEAIASWRVNRGDWERLKPPLPLVQAKHVVLETLKERFRNQVFHAKQVLDDLDGLVDYD